MDFSTRELYYLYITMPGFMCGHVKYHEQKAPIAFATFDTVENAEIALSASNGLPWVGGDEFAAESGGGTMRVNLATSAPKQHRVGAAPGKVTSQGGGPRLHPAAGAGAGLLAPARFSPYPAAPAAAEPALYAAHAAAYGQLQPQLTLSAPRRAVGLVPPPGPVIPPSSGRPAGGAAPAVGGSPTSSTLYVTSHVLGTTFRQDALQSLFFGQGFPPEKVTVKGGRAWVKYSCEAHAAAVQEQLDNWSGPESENIGLRLVFAKADTNDRRSSLNSM